MGSDSSKANDGAAFPKGKSDSEWRTVLSPQQVCFYHFHFVVHIVRSKTGNANSLNLHCLLFFYFDVLQFKVLRQNGTEPAFTSEYETNYKEGVYNCAACDTPLYKSGTKFKVSERASERASKSGAKNCRYPIQSTNHFILDYLEWMWMARIL